MHRDAHTDRATGPHLEICRPRRRARAFLAGLAVLPLLGGLPPPAAEAGDAQRVIRGAEQSPPVTPFVFDGDLRDLPRPHLWQPGDPVREIPRRFYRPPGAEPIPAGRPGLDPLLALQQELAETSWISYDSFATPSRNFPGSVFTGAVPADTVGDVGPDHFIQMVNGYEATLVVVWDKAEPEPNELATIHLDTLGKGSCGVGMGDPIVLYDRQADRWLLSEFAQKGTYLCVYVSQTGDPVSGGWYAYGFETPAFPDYPKYSVWATDANGGAGSYVVTTNDAPGGPAVYALDRGAMLDGDKAAFQRIAMPPLSGFETQGPAPAEPDGPNPPPPYEPAIVMRHHDTEIHEGPVAPGDLLELWTFDVDWDDPANTVLVQQPDIDVAEFDSDLCGDEPGIDSSSGCFPQPDSSRKLDSLREVLMHRLQYFNHGDVESLVGNFVVDADGADHGGIRWFELRRPTGGAWAVSQEGTYAIDEEHRWMASLAMDQAGDIALGHNVTSSATYPALRYTGRMADDAPGWMTQPEEEIHAGNSAHTSFRWGDYASMSLDPADDCTFWFTGMDTDDVGMWRTQSASFRFDNCGCAEEPPQPDLEAQVNGDNRIDLYWDDSAEEAVADYLVMRSRLSGGPYETLALVPDSSPGIAGGPDYVFEDHDVSGTITYYYVVVARDGEGCRSRPFNEVQATGTGPCTLPPLFTGLAGAGSAGAETCTVDLAWGDAQAECGGPVVFNVYRSTASGFTPGPENLVSAEVTGTGTQDSYLLESGVSYHYVVRAVDLANGMEGQNVVEREAVPSGPDTGSYVLFIEDFEPPESFDAWTVTNGPDHECGEWERVDHAEQHPLTSEGYYALSYSEGCTEHPPKTSTLLTSPVIDADLEDAVSISLEYAIYYTYHVRDYTGIEVWDGVEWHVVDEWSLGFSVIGVPPRDVTAYAAGNPEFQVRFRYENITDDTWWALDDVRVTAEVFDTCQTGFAAP